MTFQAPMSANVTIDGEVSTNNSLENLGTNQTLINISFYNVASGSTIYTVTEGKTLKVLGGTISVHSAGSEVTILSNGVDKYNNQASSVPTTFSGGIIMQCASTKALTVTAGANISGSLWGYEI